MLLDFRKPNVQILEKAVSYSGKYFIFYGFHYEAGKQCFVVGASNKLDGEIVMRHYNETVTPGIELNAIKAVSFSIWEKYREAMVRKPDGEETDEKIDIGKYLS